MGTDAPQMGWIQRKSKFFTGRINTQTIDMAIEVCVGRGCVWSRAATLAYMLDLLEIFAIHRQEPLLAAKGSAVQQGGGGALPSRQTFLR